MDENRLRKIYQKALDISYSGVTITEFRVLPLHTFDEQKQDWVPVSYSIMIILKKPHIVYTKGNNDHLMGTIDYLNIEPFLTDLLSYEVCVDFVENH